MSERLHDLLRAWLKQATFRDVCRLLLLVAVEVRGRIARGQTEENGVTGH